MRIFSQLSFLLMENCLLLICFRVSFNVIMVMVGLSVGIRGCPVCVGFVVFMTIVGIWTIVARCST